MSNNRNPLLYELCRQKDLNIDRIPFISFELNLFSLKIVKKVEKMAPRKAKAVAVTKVMFDLIGFFVFFKVFMETENVLFFQQSVTVKKAAENGKVKKATKPKKLSEPAKKNVCSQI